jgi:RimJ/RimL family protein N-acetyltransferase
VAGHGVACARGHAAGRPGGPAVRRGPGGRRRELFAALDDVRVWTHLAGRPASPDALAATLRDRAERLGWHQWLVRGAADGRVLGTTSYLEVSAADARLEVGSTGYTPDVWATAVNPATKLLVLGFAFDHLLAGRVQLKTDIRNTRSQQAIARLGRHVRRGPAPLPAPRRRHRPRHRAVLRHRRAVAGGQERAPGPAGLGAMTAPVADRARPRPAPAPPRPPGCRDAPRGRRGPAGRRRRGRGPVPRGRARRPRRLRGRRRLLRAVGFLITGLLLVELDRTGTVSLGRFWARRARRLLPLATLVSMVTLARRGCCSPPSRSARSPATRCGAGCSP